MLSPEHEAQIIALCERIGMPWEKAPGRPEPWHGWNGHSLNLASGAGVGSLVHEVAHWLIAPPEWRHLPGFGISGLRSEMNHPCRTSTPFGKHPDDEECAASLFGILIERALGFPWRDTWSEHNWDESVQPGASWFVRGWFRELQKLGHLRGLTPTCLLDATSSTPRR